MNPTIKSCHSVNANFSIPAFLKQVKEDCPAMVHWYNEYTEANISMEKVLTIDLGNLQSFLRIAKNAGGPVPFINLGDVSLLVRAGIQLAVMRNHIRNKCGDGPRRDICCSFNEVVNL